MARIEEGPREIFRSFLDRKISRRSARDVLDAFWEHFIHELHGARRSTPIEDLAIDERRVADLERHLMALRSSADRDLHKAGKSAGKFADLLRSYAYQVRLAHELDPEDLRLWREGQAVAAEFMVFHFSPLLAHLKVCRKDDHFECIVTEKTAASLEKMLRKRRNGVRELSTLEISQLVRVEFGKKLRSARRRDRETVDQVEAYRKARLVKYPLKGGRRLDFSSVWIEDQSKEFKVERAISVVRRHNGTNGQEDLTRELAWRLAPTEFLSCGRASEIMLGAIALQAPTRVLDLVDDILCRDKLQYDVAGHDSEERLRSSLSHGRTAVIEICIDEFRRLEEEIFQSDSAYWKAQVQALTDEILVMERERLDGSCEGARASAETKETDVRRRTLEEVLEDLDRLGERIRDSENSFWFRQVEAFADLIERLKDNNIDVNREGIRDGLPTNVLAMRTKSRDEILDELVKLAMAVRELGSAFWKRREIDDRTQQLEYLVTLLFRMSNDAVIDRLRSQLGKKK